MTGKPPLSFAQRALARPQPTDGNQAVSDSAAAPAVSARAPLNQCATCGLDFASLSAFDAHRVGKYAYEWSPEHPDGRRCLTEAELRERSFTTDKRGRWRRPASGRAPWGTR